MTPHPEIVLVEGIVHAIRSSGYIGGTAECGVGFKWEEKGNFQLLREEVDPRPRGRATSNNINCVFCLGTE